MPMFQRRHYEAVAAIFREQESYYARESNEHAALRAIIGGFSIQFKNDNPNFDIARFEKAALPHYVGPKPAFSLSDIEQAQSMVKGLKRKRA